MFDLNKTDDDGRELIPPGIYRLNAKLKPGGFGEERLLRLAKNMRTQMLELELTVRGSAYNGRKLFDLITIYADLNDSPEMAPISEKQAENYKTAVGIGLGKLRRMLESAHEVEHSNKSEEAQRIRRIETLRVFDGLEFWAEVDIKPGSNGYRDRNVIASVLMPEMQTWPGETLPKPPLKDQMDDEIPF